MGAVLPHNLGTIPFLYGDCYHLTLEPLWNHWNYGSKVKTATELAREARSFSPDHFSPDPSQFAEWTGVFFEKSSAESNLTVAIMPLMPRSKFTAPRYAVAKARAQRARNQAKRKLAVKKYEAWALKYTPLRPAAGGRPIVTPKLRRKLIYSDVVALNPLAGLVTYVNFAANGLYDPDISGVGHQPRGFDQYMALYNHYKVLASKIILQTNTTSNAGVTLLCQSSDSNGSAGSVSQWIEKAQTSWKTCQSSGPGVIQISNDFVLSRDLGPTFEEANVKGSASANPTELWYYNVAIGPDDDSTDLPQHYVRVVIEYDVEFYGPVTPSAS